MSSVQEKVKTVGFHNAATLLEEMKLLGEVQGKSGARKLINSELWHACAGPLVSLPQPGSLVYYFPQGHSEQVTATTRKTANSHIPNYQSLPSQLMCQVHNVTLHADKDTDEIYAQMTLQPVNSESDVFPIPDFGCTKSKQPNEFFCKTLTASDTSTHGGFSVPRRAAEKLFPQLDYSMQPPNQELIVRDLHDNLWTFRHIYRGQPKRHLLTTGWSLFVGAKRLKAGDSVLFIRDEKSQLLLGVRRANRQQTASPSSVLSADSMHIGVLAAAAHAAANRSPFTVYYNPRACPSEFIIPLSKYHKAAYTQVSIGMRFGMMFETEESNKRRYMGTIVGISDYDPLRWPSSKWRNLQVEWDEHGYGERPDRVSLWEIETPESLFVLPSPTPSLKRQCFPGFVVSGTEIGLPNMIRKPLSQAPENGSGDQFPVFSDLGSQQLMKALLKPQNPSPVTQLGHHQSIYASIFQNIRSNDIPGACYSTEPTLCMMGSQVQQAEAVTKTVMQQKRQYSLVQQQNLPSENIRVQYQKALGQEQQEIVDLGHESWTYMETGEQVVEESHLEQKDQDQSDLNKHRNDFPGSKSGSGSLHETVTEKPEIAFEAVVNQVDGQSESIMERPPQQLHTQQLNQLSEKDHDEKNLGLQNHENLVTGIILNQGIQVKEQSYPQLVQQHLEPNTAEPPLIESTHSLGANTVNSLLLHPGHHLSQYLDHEEWMLHPSFYQSSTGTLKSNGLSSSDRPYSQFLSASENTTSSSADISSVLNPETFNPIERFQFSCMSDFSTPQCLPNFSEELLGTRQLNCLKYPPCEQDALGNLSSEVQKEATVLQGISNSCVIKDLSDESNNQSETYSNLHFEASSGSMVVDPCVSSTELEGFSPVRDLSFHVPSESLFGNFCSNQDVQSQVTSASLTDSQAFSLQEIPYSSGGTSCSNIDVNDYSFLHKGPRNQVTPQPLRTYTKVQKLGSVGRSIDVTRFSDYHELKSSIACMFGLEGQLNDPRGSEWKLVYVDYENDVLLVGDDPWEEFVNCVRCIRILSPSEVQQMSQEGMQLMNSSTFQFPPGQ